MVKKVLFAKTIDSVRTQNSKLKKLKQLVANSLFVQSEYRYIVPSEKTVL